VSGGGIQTDLQEKECALKASLRSCERQLSRKRAASKFEKYKSLPMGGQEGGGRKRNPGNLGRTNLEGGS